MKVFRTIQFEEYRPIPPTIRDLLVGHFTNPKPHRESPISINTNFSKEEEVASVKPERITLTGDENEGILVITADAEISDVKRLSELFSRGFCYISFTFRCNQTQKEDNTFSYSDVHLINIVLLEEETDARSGGATFFKVSLVADAYEAFKNSKNA